jgi:hypothetical protein
MEHIVFLTGHLAKPQLETVLAGIEAAPFTWEARDVGVQHLDGHRPVELKVPCPVHACERPGAHLGLDQVVREVVPRPQRLELRPPT